MNRDGELEGGGGQGKGEVLGSCMNREGGRGRGWEVRGAGGRGWEVRGAGGRGMEGGEEGWSRRKREEGRSDVMTSCDITDDQCTVRVTNLSEEAQETDLKELFSHFGHIKRTFLAKDKVTQQSKVCSNSTPKPHPLMLSLLMQGFAFVSFASRDDADNAIKQLNGFGYDHLILKVEWAK
jgi:translation initiation factor 3 subunit G